MTIIFFSLLCLVLIGMTSYSYAISDPDLDSNDRWLDISQITTLPLQVMVQMELKDSNGNFLAYVEAEQIIGIHPLNLNKFLDNLNDTRKEFFIKDDKKYEIQQWESRNDRYVSKLAYSAVSLLDIYQNDFQPLLLIRHDSFQTQPGDILRIFWTIIRPTS